MCDGSVRLQTCIHRYKFDSDEYAIIHQPFPDEFLNINSTLDIFDYDYSKTVLSYSYEKWPNNLDLKLIQIEPGMRVLHHVFEI